MLSRSRSSDRPPQRALISDIPGKDGARLARLRLARDCGVFGASRDAEMQPFANLRHPDILDQVKRAPVPPQNFRRMLKASARIRPDEMSMCGGQYLVALSLASICKAIPTPPADENGPMHLRMPDGETR